jgi:hypothetical protein
MLTHALHVLGAEHHTRDAPAARGAGGLRAVCEARIAKRVQQDADGHVARGARTERSCKAVHGPCMKHVPPGELSKMLTHGLHVRARL